jgi:flagellar basal body-associated protein FliL
MNAMPPKRNDTALLLIIMAGVILVVAAAVAVVAWSGHQEPAAMARQTDHQTMSQASRHPETAPPAAEGQETGSNGSSVTGSDAGTASPAKSDTGPPAGYRPSSS